MLRLVMSYKFVLVSGQSIPPERNTQDFQSTRSGGNLCFHFRTKAVAYLWPRLGRGRRRLAGPPGARKGAAAGPRDPGGGALALAQSGKSSRGAFGAWALPEAVFFAETHRRVSTQHV